MKTEPRQRAREMRKGNGSNTRRAMSATLPETRLQTSAGMMGRTRKTHTRRVGCPRWAAPIRRTRSSTQGEPRRPPSQPTTAAWAGQARIRQAWRRNETQGLRKKPNRMIVLQTHRHTRTPHPLWHHWKEPQAASRPIRLRKRAGRTRPHRRPPDPPPWNPNRNIMILLVVLSMPPHPRRAPRREGTISNYGWDCPWGLP